MRGVFTSTPLTDPNESAPVACARAGVSIYAKGVCGDSATQTCSKQTNIMDAAPELLFAPYVYVDGSGAAHALCTGEEQCCDGGLWGNAVPTGKCLVPAVVAAGVAVGFSNKYHAPCYYLSGHVFGQPVMPR